MSVRLCTDPYAILPININECIGQSLNTINSYYTLVQENVCLQNDEVEELRSDLRALSSDVYALSSDITNFPKAFVSFSGNLSTVANTLEIFNSYNVSTVVVVTTGIYDIYFTTNFANTNFGAIATCSSVLGTTGYGRTTLGTGNYTVSSVRVRVENKDGTITTNTPTTVAVVVFA
jgi:hypothetical protein